MTFWKQLLLWTWCLPQTLLGCFALFVVYLNNGILLARKYHEVTLVKTRKNNFLGGIALGKFNFVTERCWNDEKTIQHEYGHTIQGFITGPFYLLLIGIPSIFWLIASHVSPRIRVTYHTRFPENWADRLSKIKRKYQK